MICMIMVWTKKNGKIFVRVYVTKVKMVVLVEDGRTSRTKITIEITFKKVSSLMTEKVGMEMDAQNPKIVRDHHVLFAHQIFARIVPFLMVWGFSAILLLAYSQLV